jgi:hypothetical protein
MGRLFFKKSTCCIKKEEEGVRHITSLRYISNNGDLSTRRSLHQISKNSPAFTATPDARAAAG